MALMAFQLARSGIYSEEREGLEGKRGGLQDVANKHGDAMTQPDSRHWFLLQSF